MAKDMTRPLSARTRLVHGGANRSQHGEMSEALFLTQGFAYPDAEAAEARPVSTVVQGLAARLDPARVFG